MPTLDLTPAKRCPDYQADCADVADHALCATGGAVIAWMGTIQIVPQVLPPVDGYCPYVCGMMGQPGE